MGHTVMLAAAVAAMAVLPCRAVHEGGTVLLLSPFEAGLAQGAPRRDSGGLGVATVTANTAVIAPRVRVSMVTNIAGLSTPIVAAHFHGPAWIGESAPVIAPVSISGLSNPGNSVSVDVSAEAWQLMVQGRTYFNVHTSKYPDGEIRGHLCFANCSIAALYSETERPSPLLSPAYGVAQVMVNNRGEVTIAKLATAGWLPNNAPIGAHIHVGGPNVAGPIICPINPPAAATGVPCAREGGSAFTSSQIASAQTGGWYVNVHTPANPGGEIRGQLVFPADLAFDLDAGLLRTASLSGTVLPAAVSTSGAGWSSMVPVRGFLAQESQPNGGTAGTRRYVTWTSFNGLSSPATNVALHAPATPVQVANPQVQPFPFSAGGSTTAVAYTLVMIEPTALVSSSIAIESAYLTVSTQSNPSPSGELRGQYRQGAPGDAKYAQ